MRNRFSRFNVDPLTTFRRRLIAETELALLVGWAFPERIRRIPIMEVHAGRFHPQFAIRFWEQALDMDLSTCASTGKRLANYHHGLMPAEPAQIQRFV